MLSIRLLVGALLLGLLSAALPAPMSPNLALRGGDPGKRDRNAGVQKGVLRSTPIRGGDGNYEDLDQVPHTLSPLSHRTHTLITLSPHTPSSLSHHTHPHHSLTTHTLTTLSPLSLTFLGLLFVDSCWWHSGVQHEALVHSLLGFHASTVWGSTDTRIQVTPLPKRAIRSSHACTAWGSTLSPKPDPGDPPPEEGAPQHSWQNPPRECYSWRNQRLRRS